MSQKMKLIKPPPTHFFCGICYFCWITSQIRVLLMARLNNFCTMIMETFVTD